jgi:MFS family permease
LNGRTRRHAISFWSGLKARVRDAGLPGRTTFASLAIRNYRLYFLGQGISLSGTWMQTIALGWLVLELTHSGSQLGLVTAMQFLPVLFLGAWGGVLVDRFNKRHLLVWTQSIFAVLATTIAVLIFLDAIRIWMIYAFALALGLVRVYDNPARQTFVAEMVPPERLKNAVSLNATENNLARAVGPSIGGGIIAVFGTASCFLLNGISYIAVIAMLLRMREDELHGLAIAPRKSGQFKEGLLYAQRTPVIRNTLVILALIGTFSYEFQVTLPVFAEGTFHAGAPGYAALMTALGLGAVVGGIFAAGRTSTSERQFLVFLSLFGLSMLAAAFAATLTAAVSFMVAVGAFSINVISLGNTMLQLEADPTMRGRVMSLWSVAMVGSTPIGGPIVGAMSEHLGPRVGVAVGGAVAVITAIVAAFLKRRALLKGA